LHIPSNPHTLLNLSLADNTVHLDPANCFCCTLGGVVVDVDEKFTIFSPPVLTKAFFSFGSDENK
jgi:hypothetical protein